jgi:hypothetical protein
VIANTKSPLDLLSQPRKNLRMDPSEKLEAVEAVIPPALRRGRFKAPDALIASLLEDVSLSSA